MNGLDKFVKNILLLGIKPDLVENIIANHMDLYKAAFTSSSYDPVYNYEYFEQLGDLSINKFIVSYMSKRFPHLKSSNGVGVLASLRILYGSKEILSGLSEKYGMDKYILASKEDVFDKNKFKDILEDVFEAFIGVTEYIIDKIYFNGMGYISVYNILTEMFNNINVKVDYESLVDAKTRLNELKSETKLNVVYKDYKIENGDFKTDIFVNQVLAGSGVSSTKKASQIIASENALQWILKNLNIKKEVPERFNTYPKHTW